MFAEIQDFNSDKTKTHQLYAVDGSASALTRYRLNCKYELKKGKVNRWKMLLL